MGSKLNSLMRSLCQPSQKPLGGAVVNRLGSKCGGQLRLRNPTGRNQSGGRIEDHNIRAGPVGEPAPYE